MDFKCLWEKECPRAGLCKRVMEEQSDIRQKWICPTLIGDKCPWFIPADNDKQEPK